MGASLDLDFVLLCANVTVKFCETLDLHYSFTKGFRSLLRVRDFSKEERNCTTGEKNE